MKKRFFCILLCLVLLLSLFSVSVCAEPDGALILNRESITLFADQSYVLTCSVYNNDNPKISYSSSNADIATVSANGTVRAKSAGTASITATTDSGLTTSCTVKVQNGTSPTDIILSEQYITVSSGKKHQLSAQVETTGNDDTVKYFSSDTSVATVSENGEVKALNSGIAVITAESASSAVAKKCVVKVTSEAAASLGAKNVSGIVYNADGEVQSNLILRLSSGSSPTHSSYTNSKGVFYIDNIPSGTYSVTVNKPSDSTPLATGTLSIVDSDIHATCIISDRNLVIMHKDAVISSNGITAISLAKTSLTLNQGETDTVYFNTTPTDDEHKKSIVISSDNEKVATVDENGSIKAVAKGTATITFSTPDNKISKQCVVTVEGISDSSQYSLLILICEVVPLIVIVIWFTVKYKKFIKKRSAEELERDNSL